MNDLARFKAMIKNFHGNPDSTTNYHIAKVGKYTVIYLHTDDEYCSAEMWFDKDGNFRGFFDPQP